MEAVLLIYESHRCRNCATLICTPPYFRGLKLPGLEYHYMRFEAGDFCIPEWEYGSCIYVVNFRRKFGIIRVRELCGKVDEIVEDVDFKNPHIHAYIKEVEDG